MKAEAGRKNGWMKRIIPSIMLVGIGSGVLFVNQEILFADTKADGLARYVKAKTGESFEVRQINNQEVHWSVQPSTVQVVFDGERLNHAVKVEVPVTLNKQDKVQVLANYVLQTEAEKAERETGFAVGVLLDMDGLKWNQYERFSEQLASFHKGETTEPFINKPTLSFSNLDGKLVLSQKELNALTSYYKKSGYKEKGVEILSYREKSDVYESIRFDGKHWKVVNKIAKGQSSN